MYARPLFILAAYWPNICSKFGNSNRVIVDIILQQTTKYLIYRMSIFWYIYTVLFQLSDIYTESFGQISRGIAMKEIIKMWKYSTMIGLTVICASIYMLLLIPFKSIQVIPYVTEIRLATMLPVIFGLLFGPAGAWGSAIGNLLGDFFGTLTYGSIFGFIGNFLFAYIPYRLWNHIMVNCRENKTLPINSPLKLMRFGIVSFISSSSCAVVIAWGLHILKLSCFMDLSIIITLNNTVVTLLVGPFLLSLLYPFAKKYNLIWTDIMDAKDISKPSTDKLYPFMVIVGSIGGLVFGIASEYICKSGLLNETGSGNLITAFAVLPFIAALFYGSFKC